MTKRTDHWKKRKKESPFLITPTSWDLGAPKGQNDEGRGRSVRRVHRGAGDRDCGGGGPVNKMNERKSNVDEVDARGEVRWGEVRRGWLVLVLRAYLSSPFIFNSHPHHTTPRFSFSTNSSLTHSFPLLLPSLSLSVPSFFFFVFNNGFAVIGSDSSAGSLLQ